MPKAPNHEPHKKAEEIKNPPIADRDVASESIYDVSLIREPGLSKEDILAALSMLAEHLKEAGIHGRVAIVGGAALVLAYNLRKSTKDVDAAMEPQSEVRQIAEIVGEKLNLPDGWINDAFKIFAPKNQTFVTDGMPTYEHLEVYRPTAEMLFAMKAMASRIETLDPKDSTDVKDIKALAEIIGIKSIDQAREIVHLYYPPDGKIQVPARFWYLLEPLLLED